MRSNGLVHAPPTLLGDLCILLWPVGSHFQISEFSVIFPSPDFPFWPDLALFPISAPPGFSFSGFWDFLDWIFSDSRAGLGARHWLFPMGHNVGTAAVPVGHGRLYVVISFSFSLLIRRPASICNPGNPNLACLVIIFE